MQAAPAPDTDPLLSDVERFLKASGMTATTFGVRALNDPTLVHELRRGRECKRATRARILEFIETAGERLRPDLCDRAAVSQSEVA